MRIAAFNVENLFDRKKVFNQGDNELTKKITETVTELNLLFEMELYTDGVKERMLEQIALLGLSRKDESKYVVLRKIRGNLLSRPKGKPVEVVATGRDRWMGWVELKTEAVNAVAIDNTARVIRDVNADVLAVIEAEDRISLKMFNESVLPKVGGQAYQEIMLIDGNDSRGIDVGLLTKGGFTIGNMLSHVHDLQANGLPVFSRDAPEYCVTSPEGEQIWVIPNHLKSKFGGDDARSKAKRKAQATKVAEIYKRLLSEGKKNIIVLGDLNDTPNSAALAPLLKATTLKDVSEHKTFDTGAYKGKGTYGLGNDSNKIDYLLLSPELFKRVKACGIYRKGAWPGAKPRWEVYPELKREEHSASDHHLIWVEISA